MADQIQTPETGGGEGLAQPSAQGAAAAPAEEKPAASIKPEDAKPAEAVKPAEVKPEEPKLAEAKPEDPKLAEAIPEEPKLAEAKPEEPKPAEAKPEEPKPAIAIPEASKASAPEQSQNGVAEAGPSQQNSEQPEWQKREQELLKRIEDLEKVKNQSAEEGLQFELKIRDQEIDLLKARVKNLETELQAALSKPSGKNHEMIQNIKQQHEELLSKARGMIFDKTKMVKNQELQIEALMNQVTSLKDINQITKDLLEIRNGEVKAMEDRLQVMEAKFKVEKDRFALVLQRAQSTTTINDDLKKEYETQLAIFKELREKYEQRVQALVNENTRLKEVHAAKEAVNAAASRSTDKAT